MLMKPPKLPNNYGFTPVMRLPFAAIYALMLFVTLSVQAEEVHRQPSVSGTVVGETASPLAGATVRVIGSDRATTTNAGGGSTMAARPQDPGSRAYVR